MSIQNNTAPVMKKFEGLGVPAVADSGPTDQDSVLNLDLVDNDTDPDGDTLSVVDINGVTVAANSVVTLPSGAKVTLKADGTVDYDPNGQFDSLDETQSTTDSFTCA